MSEELYKIDFNFEALYSCPFCQCKVMIPNGKIQWLDVDFWYVICPNCGLKFMNPRPDNESYREFYKNLFWQQKVRNLGFKQAGQMWQKKRYKCDNNKKWDKKEGRNNRIEKHRVQRIKTIIPVIEQYISLGKESFVLEIGSGFGVTLEEINKKFGANVNAIEPSEEARKYIKEEGVVRLLGRYADDLEFLTKRINKFDVIIFSHSLENTTNPLEIIHLAKRCLSKNGIIYIQTPNLLVFDQMNPYHPFIFSHSSLFYLADKLDMKCKMTSQAIEQMLIGVFSRK